MSVVEVVCADVNEETRGTAIDEALQCEYQRLLFVLQSRQRGPAAHVFRIAEHRAEALAAPNAFPQQNPAKRRGFLRETRPKVDQYAENARG